MSQGGGIAGLMRSPVQRGDHQRRLGGGVALDKNLPEALHQLAKLVRAHGRGAVDQRGQRREILRIGALHFQQAIQHGRHQERMGDAFAFDNLPPVFHVQLIQGDVGATAVNRGEEQHDRAVGQR
ncbi:hypothetical protein D3C76_1436840 [compost metagenome]